MNEELPHGAEFTDYDNKEEQTLSPENVGDNEVALHAHQWLQALNAHTIDGETALELVASVDSDPLHDISVQAKSRSEKGTIPGFAPVDDDETNRCLEELTNTNWVEKLNSIFSVRSLDRVVSMLIKAESLGLLTREDIALYVKEAFKRELKSAQTSYRYYEQEERKAQNKAPITSLKNKHEQLGKAYYSEFTKATDDPEYLLSWYDREKATIINAKEQMTETVIQMDTDIRNSLEYYRRQPWSSIEGRVVALMPDEYMEVMKHLYDSETATEKGTSTHGYASAPRLGMPRVAVIKLNSASELIDSNNPEEGVRLVISQQEATSTLRHEALHIVTDNAKAPHNVETAYGPRKAENRGFRRYIHNSDGTIDHGNLDMDDPPQIALDEGAVMFLERYIRFNGDLEAVATSFEGNQFGVSPAYNTAARETVQLVKEIGFDLFASCYINSRPDMWLRAVDHTMGRDWYDSYINRMKSVQESMTKRSGLD